MVELKIGRVNNGQYRFDTLTFISIKIMLLTHDRKPVDIMTIADYEPTEALPLRREEHLGIV